MYTIIVKIRATQEEIGFVFNSKREALFGRVDLMSQCVELKKSKVLVSAPIPV